jgi:hypothetical protein
MSLVDHRLSGPLFTKTDFQTSNFCPACLGYWTRPEGRKHWNLDQLFQNRNSCPLCASVARLCPVDLLLSPNFIRDGSTVQMSSVTNAAGTLYHVYFPGIQYGIITMSAAYDRGHKQEPEPPSIHRWLSQLLNDCIARENCGEEAVSRNTRSVLEPRESEGSIELSFIDVLDNRIVRGRSEDRYLALSYV